MSNASSFPLPADVEAGLRQAGYRFDGDDGLIPVWSYHKGYLTGTISWCPVGRCFYDNGNSWAQDGILDGPSTADELQAYWLEFPDKFHTRLTPTAVLREMLLATDPQGSVDEHVFLTA